MTFLDCFTVNKGWVPHSSRFWLEWDTTALDALPFVIRSDLLFLFRFCGRTNGTEAFVREPGRTAGPSAALGMTKGRAVTFIRGRQIGWIERNSRSPSTSLRGGSPLRFAPVEACDFFDFFRLVAGKL